MGSKNVKTKLGNNCLQSLEAVSSGLKMVDTSREVSFEEWQVVVARGDEGTRVSSEHGPGIRMVEIDLHISSQLPCRFLLPAGLVLGLGAEYFD